MTSLFPNSMTLVQCQSRGDSVAIITRTKNRPILLVRAFASVLCQIHLNWHMFVVNDGGDKDAVEQIVALYAPAFAGRLTVIHRDVSMGMEAASNAALQHTTQAFITVHDDDDAWHPEFLASTVSFLSDKDNERFAAVATNCIVVRERIEGDSVIEEGRHTWGYWRQNIDFAGMIDSNNFPPICLLVRKSVVDVVGSFNKDLPVLGDWDYHLRVMLVGDIGTLKKELAYYYQRSFSSESNVYGNSVGNGQTKHDLFTVYYTNSLLRAYLQKEPGFIGVLHVLLRALRDQDRQLKHLTYKTAELLNHSSNSIAHINNRMDALERMIDSIGRLLDSIGRLLLPAIHTFDQIMRVPRWGWHRIYAMRRLVARLRGRR